VDALRERWKDLVDQRAQYISELDERSLPRNCLSGFLAACGLNEIGRSDAACSQSRDHATVDRWFGMIRQLGIDPPSTDLLFYLRRDISPK
jgi:hypothetical protein